MLGIDFPGNRAGVYAQNREATCGFAGFCRPDYLTTSPADIPVRSLSELIAFNQEHANVELALFGQDLFDRAQAGPAADDPEIQRARERIRRLAGADGIDRMLAVTDRPIRATHDRRYRATCSPRKSGPERGAISGLFWAFGNH